MRDSLDKWFREEGYEVGTAATEVAASIPDLALSPDRRFLYFLNATDGEIRRLDTESSTLDDTVVKTGPGALRLRLTPNGNTLYAIALPDGHPRGQEHGTGKIIVVSAKQFKALDRFSIPVEPLDIAPDDNGTDSSCRRGK